MAIYDDIRVKIEELGGTPGTVGSLNLNGGTEIKIKYTTAAGPENHHIVPYLIGTNVDMDTSSTVFRLVAWKYKGAGTGKGWRCYKVENIVSILAGPDPRPSPLKKLRLKKQNCVADW